MSWAVAPWRCCPGQLLLAWQSLSRQQSLERELVQRQEASQAQAAEARTVAKQSEALMRDTAAKVALLDARLAEVALQRGQLEKLIQSMSRSRDENVVGDIEAAIRVAMQQTQITGSAEPWWPRALRRPTSGCSATSSRAWRHPPCAGARPGPRQDRQRGGRATLTIKLDEVVRMAEELPWWVWPRRTPNYAVTTPPVPPTVSANARHAWA